MVAVSRSGGAPTWESIKWRQSSWGTKGSLPSEGGGQFEVVEFRDDIVKRYNLFPGGNAADGVRYIR